MNLSKSGIGFSFGVPDARIGINAKGKKYIRGGIPGPGLYYQSTLHEGRDATENATPASSGVVVVAIGILAVVVLAMIGSSSHSPPVSQPVVKTAAPMVAPSPVKHSTKKKHRAHSAKRAVRSSVSPEPNNFRDSTAPESNGNIGEKPEGALP